MVCEQGDGRWSSWGIRLRACSECLDSPHFTQTFDRREYPTISRAKFRKRQTYCSIAILQSTGSKSPAERLRFKAGRNHRESDFVEWEKGYIDSLLMIERQNAILAKLDKLGWKESEITEMCGGGIPANLAGFWTSRKLSAAEWWSIKPKILLQLNNKREQVITDELFPKRWQNFKEKFDDWVEAQTMDLSLLPRIADLAVMEPFRSILFECLVKTVEFKLDEIDHVAKKWMNSRNEFMFSLLPLDLQERYRTTDFPSLKSLMILRFRRQEDRTTLHDVCRDRIGRCNLSTLQDQRIHRMLPGVDMPWNWSKADLEFDRDGCMIVKDVLQFLGQDPYDAVLDGDLNNVKCYCVECASNSQRFTPQGAKEMIAHQLHSHNGSLPAAVSRWHVL